MLIPKPLDVDALIRKAKKGKLITISEIRSRLARDNGVDTACPLTTGIFVRIVAEAAEEALRNGKRDTRSHQAKATGLPCCRISRSRSYACSTYNGTIPTAFLCASL